MAGVQIKPAVSRRRVRVLTQWGIPAALLFVYLLLFGFQTGDWLLTRYEYRDFPNAMKTPVPLGDLSISTVPRTRVSYFGYELELPWDDVDETNSKTLGKIRVTAFRSGNALWFSCLPPRNFVSEVIKDGHLDPTAFRESYGDAAYRSDYDFYRMILAVTPKKITPFESKEQAARNSWLLLVKTIAMPNADTGLYSIQTQNFRGFQFGDPKGKPFKITDELYNDAGGIDIIFLQNQKVQGPAISQAEINRVLQSLHKVADPATDASR